MKCFKMIFFVFLHNCILTTNAYVDVEQWIELMRSRELLINGKITSINEFLTANSPNDENNESYEVKYSNVMYTALKCMYADFVTDVFQYLYEIIAFCIRDEDNEVTKKYCIEATIKNFNGLKSHFVKIIYNLFYYSDKIPMLRTNDPSLLKILISINLFLYHSVNYNPFIYSNQTTTKSAETEKEEEVSKRVEEDELIEDASGDDISEEGESIETNEKNNSTAFNGQTDFQKTVQLVLILQKSIVQIIGLVGQFSCKHCRVKNYYENIIKIREILKNQKINNLDTDGIANLLNEKIEMYGSLIDIRTINYHNDNYNNSMYDPEYLLFNDLLTWKNALIEKALFNVKGSDISLKNLYETTKDEFSIGHIHKLQGYLFNTIADILYTQMLMILTRQAIFPENIQTLIQLISTFDKFVNKLLTNNCSTNNCQKIIHNRNFCQHFINMYISSNDADLLTQLKDTLQNHREIVKWEDKETVKIEDNEFILILINKIEEQPQFKSFSQITKLLSYEAHVNNDYNVHGVKHFFNHDNLDRYDSNSIENGRKLLYVLFLFRISLTVDHNGSSSLSTPISTSPISINTNTPSSSTNTNISCHLTKTKSNIHSMIDADEEIVDTFSLFDNNKAEGIPERLRDNPIGISVFQTLMYIINVYRQYIDCVFWKKTLNPLLLRFWYTTKSFDKMNNFDSVVLDQIALKTIYMIENNELINYFSPVYSLKVYESIILRDGSQTLDVENIQNDLNNKFSIYIYGYNNRDTTLLDTLSSVIIQDEFVPNDDKKFMFIWNGTPLYGFEIFRDISQSVIDVNDIVRFHWYLIKLFLAKITLKISIYFTLIKESPTNTLDKTELQNDERMILDTIGELHYSNSIDLYAINLMALFLRVFDTDYNIIEDCYFFIQKCLRDDLMKLGLVKNVPDEYTQVKDVLSDLTSDVKSFKKLVSIVLYDKAALITDGMHLEMNYNPV